MDENEPFLQRWSRLKGTRPAAATPVVAPVARPDQADHATEPASRTAAGETGEPFDLATLPRVDELTAETDITRFLDVRVPAALRNAALRQAWTLDPTIRDFIEVAENQWNWNIPGGMPGYGPLEPGTDIAALLAQATGAIVKATASDEKPDAEADVEAADDVAVVAAPAVDVPRQQPLPATGTVGGEPWRQSLAAPHDLCADDDEPSSQPRRRHGGALPA